MIFWKVGPEASSWISGETKEHCQGRTWEGLKAIENKMKYYDLSETCSVFILTFFKSLPVGHLPNSTFRKNCILDER